MTKYLIVAPPPTPNGGFHIGHVSGPYLGADICKRLLRLKDKLAVYAFGTDNNQSYVSTTAARLGVDPDALVSQARQDFAKTLRDYHLQVDLFGDQGDEYEEYVKNGFNALLKTGHLSWKTVDVLFDTHTSTYPVESYIKGICPNCYAATCGGICEACGHANNVIHIVDDNTGRYVVKHEQRLVFDIEYFRPALTEALGQCSPRPHLRNLIDHYLRGPIAPFIMSYKTGRGISTAFCGAEDQQLNVWGEMLFGHRYFLEQASGPVSASDKYVQFLGYDNSYFYVILHTAMSLALAEQGDAWPVPCAFVTNQFYNLEAEKFSTSKGHLIWANDFSAKHNTDLVRLYLALNGPELQEADFVESVFEREAIRLSGKLNRLVELYNLHVRSAGRCHEQHLVTPYAFDANRFSDFMISTAARKAINVVTLLTQKLEDGQTQFATLVPDLIQNLLSPFCPAYAEVCAAALAAGQALPKVV